MTDEKILLACFAAMDLTTLHSDDTNRSVEALMDKVCRLGTEFPKYPLPASVCVFPNFASVVRDCRPSSEVHVTAVSACFPSSQSFTEVKLREVELAIEHGAEEIDIVLSLGNFLGGDKDAAAHEIREVRRVCGDEVVLKVILETGLLKTPELIYEASMLAMRSGADFIKTSTGKVEVNATPHSARVMCRAIRDYYAESGRKVGFKAAGGISTAEDAVVYYETVREILGEEWLGKDLFRLGVSRLGNALISAIEGREVKFF